MIAELEFALRIWDDNGRKTALHEPDVMRWTPTVRKMELVSLTGSAFTALSPPTGATAVLILPSTNVSLTLKGVTGDTGVTIAPASNALSLPLFLPLGATPSIGITNGSSSTQTLYVYWV